MPGARAHRGAGGRFDSTVRLLPPLIISDEQVEAVLDRLTDAIATVTALRTSGASS